MCHRACFREDKFEKCISYNKKNNGTKLFLWCIKLKELRDKLINVLNKFDKKIDKLNLNIIIILWIIKKNNKGNKIN